MISIKITSGTETVEINLPKEKETDSLKDTLNEFDDPFYGISPKLLKNDKFKELFEQSLNQFNYNLRKSTRLMDGLTISEDGTCQTIINDQKWKKAECLAFNGMFKQNIEMLIIHVSGSLNDEDKDRMIDRIYNQLPPIRMVPFKTKRKDQTTVIELFFFGTEPLQEKRDYERL